MDESKGSLKPILKKIILISVLFLLTGTLYIGYIYSTTLSIPNPTSCFTTRMHKVNLCDKNTNYTPYQKVSPLFFHALIMSEDASFYSHKGFDWFEIQESIQRNIADGKLSRGGSTLTQQLAKNLYLSAEKTFNRKIRELFITQQLEDKLSKNKILEIYANVVEFGFNLYGISEASQHYFSKTPQNLNLLESVYLVSLLPNPKQLSQSFKKKQLSKSNLRRMRPIVRRLYKSKKIPHPIYIYADAFLDSERWPFQFYNPDLLSPFSFDLEEEIVDEINDLESKPEDTDTLEDPLESE